MFSAEMCGALGVNSVLVAKTLGVQAVMYGCKIMELSDPSLHVTSTKMVRAASPVVASKNLVLTLLAIEGQV